MREETGIESEKLQKLGHIVAAERNTIYFEYLCVTNCDKDSIMLQEGETSAYKWVSRDELLSMKKTELVTERMQGFIRELQLPTNRDLERHL